MSTSASWNFWEDIFPAFTDQQPQYGTDDHKKKKCFGRFSVGLKSNINISAANTVLLQMNNNNMQEVRRNCLPLPDRVMRCVFVTGLQKGRGMCILWTNF